MSGGGATTPDVDAGGRVDALDIRFLLLKLYLPDTGFSSGDERVALGDCLARRGTRPAPGFWRWTPVLGFLNEDDLPRSPARSGPLRGRDGGVHLAEDSDRSKGVGCPAPTSPPDRVSTTRLSSTTRADSDSSSI